MKKFISLALACGMIFTLAACNDEKNNPAPPDVDDPSAVVETLTAPTNVNITEAGSTGIVRWDAVANATEYVVSVNGVEQTTRNTYIYLDSLTVDYQVFVVARAENYNDSAPSQTVVFNKHVVTIGIEGGTDVRSGKTLQLTAKVTGSEDKKVRWEITKGGEFATVDENGLVTAKEVTGDKIITVTATSVADGTVSVSKQLTVTAKPVLTQAMLDKLQTNKISFEGYLTINLYNFGITNDFYRSFSSDVLTAMDGTNWYTRYENVSTGISTGLYYKNNNGVASQVSVSFMNDEEYAPMLDDDGNEVSWEKSGLYNNFIGLKVSDFPFNETTWRYEYKGSDPTLVQRMIASANPYDFVPKNLALIVEEDEIAGIYSEAEDDYTIVQQYVARQELTVVVNAGEDVEVPTVSKYQHNEKHDKLAEAIENMHSLESYTVDFLNIGASSMTQGYTLNGFEETVTNDVCHFRPFRVTGETAGVGQGNRDFTGQDYGYVKIGENLYNSYDASAPEYSASRAFTGDFKTAKPSFAFAAEIFNKIYEDPDNGTTTYYVDTPMMTVASTFYYGLGNDIALYGLFAAEGQTSETSSFTPYVVVKDGYIVESGFYYYLGYLYGVVEIAYGDFDKTKTPAEVQAALAEMPPRAIPASWADLTIQATTASEQEIEVNALDFLKEFFYDEAIAEKLPFFGDALGDTYGFGMETFRVVNGVNRHTVAFYYDVPLDVDYSIESSIRSLHALLIKEGFQKDKDGIYTKGSIAINVVDADLDFTIYVWKI